MNFKRLAEVLSSEPAPDWVSWRLFEASFRAAYPSQGPKPLPGLRPLRDYVPHALRPAPSHSHFTPNPYESAKIPYLSRQTKIYTVHGGAGLYKRPNSIPLTASLLSSPTGRDTQRFFLPTSKFSVAMNLNVAFWTHRSRPPSRGRPSY